MMIDQDQKDMAISPIITSCTVKVARAKSARNEKSISGVMSLLLPYLDARGALVLLAEFYAKRTRKERESAQAGIIPQMLL